MEHRGEPLPHLPGHVTAMGVDGCRAGWIGASARAGDPSVHVAVFPDISTLCAWAWAHGERPVVAIDVPIGLPERVGARACDTAARAFLRDPDGSRHRSNSVFAPADRQVLAAGSYADARAVIARRQRTEPAAMGVSAQSFGIAPKIREVDTYACSTPDCHDWLFEAHPEVCFREMSRAGEGAGLLPKKSAAGQAERLELLGTCLPPLGVRRPATLPRVRGAGDDDVIDAFACLWTALRHRAGRSCVLGDGARDAMGIPMRIVY
jgi:predicted RNase H-like nuclease